MPPRTQPNIYFVAFDMEILQMIGKSVRWMWTAQNRDFPRIVSRCAPFPAAPARPTAARHNAGRLSCKADTRGRPLLAVRLRLGGMGAGGMQSRHKPGVSPPNTENTKKTPFSFKNPAKNKKAIFNFIKAPFCCYINIFSIPC